MRGVAPPTAGVTGRELPPPPSPALILRLSLLFIFLGAPDAVLALVAKFALALSYTAACSRYCRRRSFM